MPISGLVITLSTDPRERRDALAALANHSAVECGETDDNRMPIVVDTPDSDADRAVWEWLHQQRGITFVDVAYVHFETDSKDRAGAAVSHEPKLHCCVAHANASHDAREEGSPQ